MTTTADVRIAQRHDRVVVTPRRSQDFNAVSRALRNGLPGVRVVRSADGLSMAAMDAAEILSADHLGLQLRWEPEARMLAENRQRVRTSHGIVREALASLLEGGADRARELLSDVDDLSALDDHQLVNVAAMTLPDGFGLCVFDEQGAGKTVTTIFAFDVLSARDQVDFLLIIAPMSMVTEWPRDFQRFKPDLYRVEVAIGGARAKRSAIRSRADVLVTNFETAVSLESDLRALLKPFGRRAALVVDESFFVKNLDTQRTQAVRRLREWCGRAFVLCGTPAPNTAHDIVEQFNVVDFGLTFDPVRIPDDRGAAIPVVQRAMEDRGLFVRHLKRDVLPNLPGKTFTEVTVSLAPDQERLYRGALNNLVVDLESTDDATFSREIGSYLARRHALLQICSNPLAVTADYEEVPAKLGALDEILDDLVARGEKVVIWSFYSKSLKEIANRYRRFSPVRFDGSTPTEERQHAIRSFQQDDKTMLFVGNPAAAGAGITLHRARFAIYESFSNQAAHFLQSLDRIHRRGQDREVQYLVLLCDRTIEVAEYDRLKDKQSAAQTLLGDTPDETTITRSSMLSEARRLLDLLGD